MCFMMLFTFFSYSQNDATTFHTVVVEMVNFVDLQIDASNESDSYSINEKQSGEYSEAVVFKSYVANDTLFFEDSISPVFELPQDKLSAHKITDSKAHIKIPANKSVFISMDHTNALITGSFEQLRVNVRNGAITFDSITGNTEVVTINANVSGVNFKNYKVSATTRNGVVVSRHKKGLSRYTFDVESVNGNIEIQ
ncbi:hypothetical protein SAMN05192588_1968 [Nonlabens sp. Hel1_33_55]|nr:hypothetical protein SAMN05192588_1968 [Nonlabens sp. Hel1_33_55]